MQYDTEPGRLWRRENTMDGILKGQWRGDEFAITASCRKLTFG
jgi:hypothetical protein